MFLNYLKNFFTQKIVKNSIANVNHIPLKKKNTVSRDYF